MNIKSLFLLILFSVSSLSLFSQTSKKAIQLVHYPNNVKEDLSVKEKMMMKEVFNDKYSSYILNNPGRLKNMKHLLRNRIVIKRFDSPLNEDKYTNLSKVPLFNVYNTSLKRDIVYSPKSFNPLKYNLDFFRIGGSVYKIFDTPFYIIIKSQTTTK